LRPFNIFLIKVPLRYIDITKVFQKNQQKFSYWTKQINYFRITKLVLGDKMNIIVTGGAGFIGSNLIEYLLNRGHIVTSVDNYKTGKKENLYKLFNNKNLCKVVGDLSEVDIENRIKDCHIVFHLASSVGVDLVDKDPNFVIQNNLKMAFKLFPLIDKYKKKLVFTSTSEVYGDKAEKPFSENDIFKIGTTKNIRWCYASTKIVQEFLIKSYNFPSIIIRPFNVVGHKQVGDYGMVLPKFINWAKKGKPLKVHGDGQQTRCFCHINDFIKALVDLSFEDGAYGETVNIGNTEEITILDLAKKVIEITKSKSKIEFIPYEKAFLKNHGEVIKRIPDIAKLKSLINFTPQKTLEEIIEDMIHEK